MEGHFATLILIALAVTVSSAPDYSGLNDLGPSGLDYPADFELPVDLDDAKLLQLASLDEEELRGEDDETPDENSYSGVKVPHGAYGASSHLSAGFSKPPLDISIGTHAILSPQLEILRVVEAFFKLKGEMITRFQALVNDNYDLIKAVINLFLNKLSTLHSFSLKGISVLRRILEFSLTVFKEWHITLPSISLGVDSDSHVGFGTPHETYGAPHY